MGQFFLKIRLQITNESLIRRFGTLHFDIYIINDTSHSLVNHSALQCFGIVRKMSQNSHDALHQKRLCKFSTILVLGSKSARGNLLHPRCGSRCIAVDQNHWLAHLLSMRESMPQERLWMYHFYCVIQRDFSLRCSRLRTLQSVSIPPPLTLQDLSIYPKNSASIPQLLPQYCIECIGNCTFPYHSLFFNGHSYLSRPIFPLDTYYSLNVIGRTHSQ